MYYTKYRPQKFSEIQKPNEIADALMQEIKIGRTVHAYLFTGPRGVGKTTMARLLAKALSCLHLSKNGDVCGKCEFCLSIQKGSLLDLVEIDAASNRGIDDIRDLRDKVKLLPAGGKKKIYIIDEVHMLTNEAFNALLKTLEEPPKHAVFILCTTEFHKVPETIKSRCQVFKFKRASKVQLVERLRKIADAEAGVEKIALKELERVAIMAGGAFRDAETILQQMIEGGVTEPGATGNYMEFVSALSDNDGQTALKLVDKIVDEGNDLTVWIDGLSRFLRDVLHFKMGFPVEYFNLDDESLADRKKIACTASIDWLIKTVEVFNQAGNDLKTYSIPQLALEIAVIKLIDGEEERRTDLPQEDDGGGNQGDNKKDRSAVPAKGGHILPSSGVANDGKENIEDDSLPVSQAMPLKEIAEGKWKEVVMEVMKINNSISALLKSGKPMGVEANFIVLEVSYKFHKERLESSINRKIVEKVLEDVFGKKMSVKCMVCQKERQNKEGETGDLTDLNVRIPQRVDINSKTSVIEVFDGGLPL